MTRRRGNLRRGLVHLRRRFSNGFRDPVGNQQGERQRHAKNDDEYGADRYVEPLVLSADFCG